MEKLHFLSGPLRGTTVDLTETETTIGRSSDNTICINDKSVSDHHATITRRGQDFVLQDAGSTKGVYVGSEKVVVTMLKDGNRIAFGSVEARFETSVSHAAPIPESASSASAPAAKPGLPKLQVAVALLFLFGSGYAFYVKSTKPEVNSIQPNFSQSGPYFKTHWQDESQFIVETIIQDLAEMAFYAKHKKLPADKEFSVTATEKPASPFRAPGYEVRISLSKTLPIIKDELNVNDPIWSPTIYKGLVKKLFAALGIVPTDRPAADAQDAKVLSQLTELTAANIEEQNQALSKRLADQFCNATLHEQAAVILGAFTMREHAMCFMDIRSPLCRMTAHLAMANGLANSSGFGISGEVAEAMLFSLMNNQKDALDKLAKLENAPAAVQPWLRAIRTRNTYDYRLLADIKQPTLLEKIELFRARCHCIDVQMFWDKLSDSDKKNVPDYCRIAGENHVSVETGHQLLAVGLPLEFIELRTTYALSAGTPLGKQQWVEALNRMPDRCFSTDGKARVHIIGWGQWAAFFQRHLCHTLDHNYDFMKNRWGVPDQALQFAQQSETLFSQLRLYPFVRRLMCTNQESYHRAVDEGFAVTVATPHLVSPQVWNNLCCTVTFAPPYQPNPNPHINEWHKHNPPPGTAYNPLPRMDHSSLVARPDTIMRLEELHKLAPYDNDVSFNLLRLKYHHHATYEQTEEVYRPLLEYDAYRLYYLAETIENQPDQSAKYEAVMLKVVAVDPYRYYALANHFIRRKEEDKAAVYMEKGMNLNPDAVAAANNSGWLVKYYQRHNMLSKAMELADQAAAVYSYRGLQAKAELLESLGKYGDALEYYKRIEERYNDTGIVMGFLCRFKTKTGNGAYDKELQERLDRLFPKGVEKVTINDLHEPPQDGVIINEENDLLRQAGLKHGDIIVALYGIRVHNFEQYGYARESDPKPEMVFIVWTGHEYVERKASPPRHRFGLDFATYTAR